MQIVINGEVFTASRKVVESLFSNGTASVRFHKYSDDIQLSDSMFGITVRMIASELTARAKGKIEAEIISTPVLFYYVACDGDFVIVSDGYNDGSSYYSDHEGNELRLNNVYGRGDIYHKLTIFNVPSWVRVGRYNLPTGDEDIVISDEDALLSIETDPHIVRRLLHA